MRSSRLALVALASAVALAAAARGGRIAPLAAPAPASPRPSGSAIAGDPSDPQPSAEVSSGGSGLTAASSAKGTALKFRTTGSWQGSASLAFKGSAPPMRLTLTLAGMQQYDLGSLTLTSGKLSLQLGRVTAAPSTRYFDSSGREQAEPERAAYAVTARRYDGGEVDVEVRRAPGASLGSELTVGWNCGRMSHVLKPGGG